MRARYALIAPALLTLVVLSGCASEPPSSPASSLDAALAATPVTEASTSYFGFTDFSRLDGDTLEEALQGTLGTPLQATGSLGLDVFGSYALLVEDLLPDPAAEGATASSIGVPPNSASRFTGVRDPSAALAHVSAEGVELGEGRLIVRRDDHHTDFNDEEFPPGLVARLNVIWHDDDTVIAGTTRAAVESWATGDAPTLDGHYAGASSCLGEVAAAGLVSADFARTANDVAIGVSSGDEGFTQTLCIRSENASADIPAIEERIAQGTDMRGTPLNTLIVGASVEDAGEGWVRVRTDDAASASLAHILMNGDMSAVTG